MVDDDDAVLNTATHGHFSDRWDPFVLAGQGRGTGDGSTVDAEDAPGSPDGLWVDPDGTFPIQTDGAQPAGANDQMLAANPPSPTPPASRRSGGSSPGCGRGRSRA